MPILAICWRACVCVCVREWMCLWCLTNLDPGSCRHSVVMCVLADEVGRWAWNKSCLPNQSGAATSTRGMAN
jgi:hypothetical protein